MPTLLDTVEAREAALDAFIDAFVAEHAPLSRAYSETQ